MITFVRSTCIWDFWGGIFGCRCRDFSDVEELPARFVWHALRRSGRQPDLSTTSYDALLFTLKLAEPRQPATVWEALCSWAEQPLRSCGPWALRVRVHRYQGHASQCQVVPLSLHYGSGTGPDRGSESSGRTADWLGRMFGRPRTD